MAEVVLVHGAWHGAWCWDGVMAELAERGVTATAVQLPFTGLADDIATARTAIETAGPGSVVVGHSYGGTVISAAASGLPDVARLIYLAAFLTEPDTDTVALVTEQLGQAMVVDERGISVDPAAAPSVFYGDSDPAVAVEMAARLRPVALSAIGTYETEPAWKTVPATYVVCGRDQAIRVGAQREMAANAETVLEWPTDHSPFLTRPAAVAELAAGYLA
jgi:pimeloyl-ACP methyl ester carboxylesterase